MEVNQMFSTTTGKKKRKCSKSEHVVKAAKMNVESNDNHLDHNKHKVFRTSSNQQKSTNKVVPNSSPQKKHFKPVNKMKDKVYNHFKENGSCTATALPSDQISVPVSQDRSEKYHGTNGSGLIKGKPRKECAKEQNVNCENNILLARIERKGICSNWKTFKEVVKKDDSVNSLGSKSITKKEGHRKNMKPNKDISNGLNVDLKSANVSHSLKKWKKHHSGNFQDGKASSGKLRQQESIGSTPHKRLTKEIALDCEMVGTEDNSDMVARVSMVNKFGECVYDKYVTPTEKVFDYRTWVSGIRPANLKNAEDFKQVQKEVAELLQGRLLVGHAVRNDLKVLFLSHPRRYTRDTQRCKLFRELAKTKRPSLKKLASAILNISIQEGEHSSVEDAKAAMQLYMLYQKKWEKLLRKSKKKLNPTTTAVTSE